MKNSKANKSGDTLKNRTCFNRNSDLSNTEISTEGEWLTEHFNDEKIGFVENTEDADEINNDSNTSSPFSLQECMKEFRARRMRRATVSRICQKVEKYGAHNTHLQETTEQDLINQNLCNKEQERKNKPCENGFCYCFTSDSGDAAVDLSCCYASGNKILRNPQHIACSECIQSSTLGRKTGKLQMSPVNEAIYIKSSTKARNMLKAQSMLETSTGDSPFIHIIQEIQDNCVTTKVKLNKHKIRAFANANATQSTLYTRWKRSHFRGQGKYGKHIHREYTPTAPILEIITDLETTESNQHMSSSLEKCRYLFKGHRKDGGQLLKKRISVSNISYKPRVINQAPPKPPRTYISPNKIFESSASTSSVRKAKREIDNFMANKSGELTNAINNKYKKSNNFEEENIARAEIIKTDWTQTPTNLKKPTKNIETHSERSNKESSNKKSNVLPLDNQNVPQTNLTAKNVTNIACNEANIMDMLSCNVTKKLSTSHKAQPQQIPGNDVIGSEKCIGWEINNKRNLNVVNGTMHHNLVSNLENKNTPVKTRLFSQSQNKDNRSWRKLLWSPWPKKYSIHHTDNNKQNLLCTPKSFIISSKNKFVQMISPKNSSKVRNNDKVRKTSLHNIGIQTLYSQENIPSQYQQKSSLQTSLGSYHLPVQSLHTQNNKICASSEVGTPKKTYQSFKSELDQDISITNINYILSNLRAKLEASEQHIVRTFLETDFTVERDSYGLDCPDSHELRMNSQPPRKGEDICDEAIYSEIECDKVYISSCPDFQNRASIQNFTSSSHPEILYAKVNKCRSERNGLYFQYQDAQNALPKTVEHTWKDKKIISKVIPLPALTEPTVRYSNSPYSSRFSSLSHCQSLNNIQVKEHSLSRRSTSKTDLSIQRSEIFFENLCKSELVVLAESDWKNLREVQNLYPNDVFCVPRGNEQTLIYNDTVSYELPNDEVDGLHKLVDVDNVILDGSNLALSPIAPSSTDKQSTPKKQSFVTKDKPSADACVEETGDNFNISLNIPRNQSDDQQNISHTLNKIEEFKNEGIGKSNIKTPKALKRCKSLKSILHKSFQKSKMFIKNEGKRPSRLNLSANDITLPASNQSCIDSNRNLDGLVFLTESSNLSEQIAHAVSFCRKLPNLEISMEMVEAERLLLCSVLHQKNKVTLPAAATRYQPTIRSPRTHFFIDDIFMPVLSDVSKDIYFNYFYIIVFECEEAIKSTQSAECENGAVIFRDIGVEFISCTKMETDNTNEIKQKAIKCKVFMLRLRKISTAHQKQKTETHSSTQRSISSSSLNEVVSRFRLHASFTLDAKDFVPYEYVSQESNNSDKICLRSSGFYSLPLVSQTKSTNLSGQVRLKARAEVRLLKHVFKGFLNVEDPDKQHNWNRRWCTLDGIFLYVWQDKNILNTSPLITLDLRDSKHNINSPLTCSPRELCARPRSFFLNYKIKKPLVNISTAAVYFAADTQEIVNEWLKNINIVLDFISTWL